MSSIVGLYAGVEPSELLIVVGFVVLSVGLIVILEHKKRFEDERNKIKGF